MNPDLSALLGYPIRRDVVAHLSPSITQNWRRYDDYPVQFNEFPDSIDPSFDLGEEA